jgi:hypothetical protein
MNLKEEIEKCSYPVHQFVGPFPNDQVCNKKDVFRIAGEYAKEQAWESRKFAMIEHGHWPPDWREYENKQREIFEKWWEENK